MEEAGVVACASARDALGGADLVLAGHRRQRAGRGAGLCRVLREGALFDMNSVAPDTKRAAAHAVEAAGGRYVDVAVLAPVHPARLKVPLLVRARRAEAARRCAKRASPMSAWWVTTSAGPARSR
jgi:3-hydroxyisobutyrate dehydrogenase-like beta-hydroxyacid dehydrogenase